MDKTNEELKLEIEELTRKNLEVELAKEKAKLEEAEKADKDKQELELRETIRAECVAELAQESNIDANDETATLDGGHTEFQAFLGNWRKKNGLVGLSYEEQIKQRCQQNGGGF